MEEKKIRCLGCRRRLSPTVGTFFHRVRKFRVWLAAIFLLENGFSLSSNYFAYLTGVAQSSALHILKSVYSAIDTPSGDSSRLVSSSHFLPLFMKRSFETHDRLPPSSEEEFAFQAERLKQGACQPEPEVDEDKIDGKILSFLRSGARSLHDISDLS